LATNLQRTGLAPAAPVLTAVRRHWFIALLPVALLVAGAVALASKRPARYDATAVLSVGHVYVSTPAGIPSIIDATQALAATYSRAIHAGEVQQDTARRLGRGASVTGEMSATPIPDSQLIKVSAESSSALGAVTLANAGADALAAYVNRQVRDNDAATMLATRYRQAALEYRQAHERSDRLRRRYSDHHTRANKRARDEALAATDTALLRREAVRASYQQAVQGGTASVGVEVFSRASGATSDRRSKMQILIFVGLVGGIAAGVALALLRTAREIRLRGD
jgi:capsular polysaccharide biosynthesis protein